MRELTKGLLMGLAVAWLIAGLIFLITFETPLEKEMTQKTAKLDSIKTAKLDSIKTKASEYSIREWRENRLISMLEDKMSVGRALFVERSGRILTTEWYKYYECSPDSVDFYLAKLDKEYAGVFVKIKPKIDDLNKVVRKVAEEKQ